MNCKDFTLGDWIGHISGVIEDESELDGNEMRDLVNFLSRLSRWTSVSEKLPKAGEYVGSVAKYYLVQNEYGDMLVARYTHSGYWEEIYQMKPIADEIVAWCELPQPHKTEKEV